MIEVYENPSEEYKKSCLEMTEEESEKTLKGLWPESKFVAALLIRIKKLEARITEVEKLNTQIEDLQVRVKEIEDFTGLNQ